MPIYQLSVLHEVDRLEVNEVPVRGRQIPDNLRKRFYVLY